MKLPFRLSLLVWTLGSNAPFGGDSIKLSVRPVCYQRWYGARQHHGERRAKVSLCLDAESTKDGELGFPRSSCVVAAPRVAASPQAQRDREVVLASGSA